MDTSDYFCIEADLLMPAKGKVLISEPLLDDASFSHSVIMLLEHGDEGSLGLVLNKCLPFSVNQLVSEFRYLEDIPIYKGGPVGFDTLFYLHTLSDVEGALPVGARLYLNGDFNAIKRYVLQGNPVEGRIRFFLGYAGWSAGQLQQELEEGAWAVSQLDVHELMNNAAVDNLWRSSVSKLNGPYAVWKHFPDNISLN